MAALWSPEHKVGARAPAVARGAAGPARPRRRRARRRRSRRTRRCVDQVDLDSIAARERVTRHDVKARIEEFAALAGHEQIHKGMTSRDLTENVEQLQVRQRSLLVRDRAVAALARLADLAGEHDDLVMAGRSHNVAGAGDHAGQAVRHRGRRAAGRVRPARRAARALPAARHQGPGRHRAGQLDLLDGDADRLAELERRGRRAPRLRAGARPASARSTRARSTSTSCRPWCSSAPARPRWPRRSG